MLKTVHNSLCLSFFFVQAKFDHDMPCETVSKINLVDLAGRYMVTVAL